MCIRDSSSCILAMYCCLIAKKYLSFSIFFTIPFMPEIYLLIFRSMRAVKRAVSYTHLNASADVARTYLLLSLKDKKTADMYMDLFCVKTGTEKRYVQGWLPIVAAAQLAYKRPEEKELLESWINVFDYQ